MRGLVNSAKPLRNLACRRVYMTTSSPIGTPVQVSFCWYCKWMILLSLRVTLKVSHLFKSFLQSQFHTKDFGMLRYFLGIEVMRSKHGIFLSQRKYVLDLLFETGKLGVKPCNSPMVPRVHLTREGATFEDPKRYRRLVEKLNYFTITRPDITHSVSIVS